MDRGWKERAACCCSSHSASLWPVSLPFPHLIRGSSTPLTPARNERDAALSMPTAGAGHGASLVGREGTRLGCYYGPRSPISAWRPVLAAGGKRSHPKTAGEQKCTLRSGTSHSGASAENKQFTPLVFDAARALQPYFFRYSYRCCIPRSDRRIYLIASL